MSLAVLRRLRAGARGVVGAVLEEAAATEKSWTRGEVRGLQAWAAGCGDHGRLGTGAEKPRRVFSPVEIREGQQVLECVAIAAGGAHSVFVTDNGDLYSCGLNNRGQLGHSPTEEYVLKPTRVDGLDEAVVDVAAGHHHTIARTKSGALWAFGCNAKGQLGLGSSSSRRVSSPHIIEALKDCHIVHVSAGAHHSLAVDSKGQLFSWGEGSNGRLGHGHPPMFHVFGWLESSPRLVRSLEGVQVVQASAGHTHTAVVDSQGLLYCCGNGRFGQLGISTDDEKHLLEALDFPNSVLSVSCGGNFSLVAQRESGLVFSMGLNSYGVLGLGNKKMQSSVGQAVSALERETIVKVSAGWQHCGVITESGKLFMWGWGGSMGTFIDDTLSSGGQLGLGSEFNFSEPQQVTVVDGSGGGGNESTSSQASSQHDNDSDDSDASLTRVHALSCGVNHSLILT